MRNLFLILLLLSANPAASADLTPEQLEAWFNNDDMEMPEQATVQDKQLRFITAPNAQAGTLTEKTYRITADSLQTGWVVIEQCYRNLDPVPQLEVVYNYQDMRNLKVTQQAHIGKLWIEGQSIQMQDLNKNASVCTRAEVKILRAASQHKYLLLAGPFQRKFLDGYYPMHVKLRIEYPAAELAVDETHPQAEPGFMLTHAEGLMQVDTRFTGKLYLAISFTSKDH
ncbi:MAG: hypothetical protein R6X06_03150 [Gammaproteobacteria bacterium]